MHEVMLLCILQLSIVQTLHSSASYTLAVYSELQIGCQGLELVLKGTIFIKTISELIELWASTLNV